MGDGWETQSGDTQATLGTGAAPDRPVAAVEPPGAAGAEPDPLIGATLLGQYKILTKLGKGGMGAVYLAEQAPMGRRAAVKFLLPDLGDDAETVKRFNREARAASTLSHPNIVEIYNFGRTPERNLFLAMEYIDGRSLTEILKQGPMSPRTVCELGAQLCDALALAHKAGVVHRDLKPDNILVRTINDRLVPKLVDFGIAKVVAGSGAHETALTSDGKIFGTPNYMAPEQARGRHVEPRTDIYSMGVILYQMLTGKLPIRASTPVAQILAVATVAPEPVPPDIAATLPPGLGELLMRMLAKEPKQRPSSMLAVRNALVAANAEGRVAELPPERRWFVPAAATLLVMTLAVLVAAQWRLGVIRALPHAAAPTTASAAALSPLAPRVVSASASTRPAWLKELGPDSSDARQWSFRLAARHQRDLEKAKTELREMVADAALAAMAGRVEARGFAAAVDLPVAEAKRRHEERLLEAELRGNGAEAEQLRAGMQAIRRYIFGMFEVRFPEILALEELYWEELEAGTLAGPERFVEAYADFVARPDAADLAYYAETRVVPALGVSVTHFFPTLAWIHGQTNGVVVLETKPGSLAERFGLVPGDVIVAVGEAPTAGLQGFDEVMAARGTTSWLGAKLEVSRRGKIAVVDLGAAGAGVGTP
jgi:serine/threonine-protein kinase